MRKVDPDNQKLRSITLDDTVRYLQANNWRKLDHANDRLFVFEGPTDDNGEPIKLILPQRMDYEDTYIRLAEVINSMAAIQEKSPYTIINEIAYYADDTRKLVEIESHDTRINTPEPQLGRNYMQPHVTFYDWVKEGGGRLYLRVSVAFTASYGLFQGLRLFGFEQLPIPKVTSTSDTWLTVSYFIHVIFIAFVAGATAYKFSKIKSPDSSKLKEWIFRDRLELQSPSEQKKDTATAWVEFKHKVNKVVRQFTMFWLLAWASWLFHYGYLLLEKVGLVEYQPSFRNLVNNLNSLMFIFMFMTLTVSTSRYGPFFWGKLASIVCIVSAIQWATYPLAGANKEAVAVFFAIISGLFASVALAAFVGSIDSKFINVPIWLILSLYLYAAIQALYIFFELEHVISMIFKIEGQLDPRTYVQRIQIAITIFSFLLKTMLFLAVTWILRTGRLVYFMMEEGSLNFKRDENFKAFLERIEIEEASIS